MALYSTQEIRIMQGLEVDPNEAPEGFIAVPKPSERYVGAPIPNICGQCDARKLCQDNIDNWCLKNRCMAGGVIFNGVEIQRKDKSSVIFKKIS